MSTKSRTTQALGSYSTSAISCCRCGLGRDAPHTYHKVISRPDVANSKSVEAVLKMRRANGQPRIYNNSDRGYDMITLPDGKKTVVFTKKEIRIDSQGNMIKEAAQRKSRAVVSVMLGRGKEGMKALQKKLLRQEAARKK